MKAYILFLRLVVIPGSHSVYGRIGAEPGILDVGRFRQFAQIFRELLRFTLLGEFPQDQQMLAEIVPESPGGIHIGPQFIVALLFHLEHLVFPFQPGTAD